MVEHGPQRQQSQQHPGCHTIAARYVNTAACGLTAALTPSTIAGCDASADVSLVIFPSAPVITMPRASCMSDFILPAVPPVAGFSIQYSINGGAWTASPMTSMVPGCYSIQARYVLETACGTTLAGTAGTGSCGASNMVNTNVYPVPVVEPVADVFMCDMSQVNVTFSSLTEILSCYGNASIQYQWTNNNTSIGLAASGTGNISFIATQPGTAFIIVTPVFTGPDGSCKGQPISFIISIHQEISIVCNDRIHVSLDENCEFNMSGDFILEGSYNEYFYNVVIKTSTGEIIDNSNVTLHIGEVLIAEVTDICNGNRCWGEVIFEDKLAPVVECNCSVPSEDCTFNCYDLAVIQNETVPMLYGASPNKSVLTTPPTATDGCGPVSATFTDAINGGDQCDTRELVRSWTFEDASGNKSYCTQRFAFEPISVTDLIPPVREVHLTCGLDATPAAISGYLDVDSRTQPANATNIGAYADDYAQTGSVVELHEGYANGYFTYNQIGYDGKLHAQKVDNNVCNLYTTYTDDVIPACGIGCSGNMKVIRNWKLLDWCTGEVFTYTQVIKATDEKAPTFNVKNATVGVDPWGCAANWNVGQPWELADNCAKAEEIKWGVKVPSGVTLSGTFPNYRITGLTKGVHTITYWASDCCGNVSEKTATVTVIDASAPVAVAKQNIVMSLTGSGTGADGAGKIYGWQIDNGSYDHCSDVRFEVRRVDGGSCGNVGANGTHNNNSTYNDNNGYPSEVPGAVWFHPQDNAQDTDGGEFVKFCCEDIPAGADYGLHDVELRVWDDGNMNGVIGDNDIINGMKDNYNTTWVTIRVENKLPPALVCPPDVTITCDMELNLSLDSETNVNDVNLTMTGYPQAFDLCSNLQVTYKDQWVGTHDPVCKSGTVRRTFKVTKGAVVVTCPQFITVATLTAPFTVTFPNQNQTTEWDKCSFTLDDARDAANASIKRPIVNYGQCDIVGENITIDTFLFEDGACKKWRVKYSYKNWCTGEEINTIAGLPIVHWYAFKDVTAPVLSCTNQMFAANPNPQNPNGGCEAAVALEASASDKLICAEESWIKWQMFFDGWNDGTVDRLGSSFVNKSWNGIWVPQAKYIAGVLNPTWVALQDQHPNLPLADLVYVTYIKPTAASGGTAKLPVGTGATAFILNAENISHKVTWKVTDGCGNVDQCESTVMVVDKKAPTPYCVSVSTALMQTNPQMVELWARDFDKGAFDNCTPQSKLCFTFDGVAPIYSRVNDEHFYKVVGGVSVNATQTEYLQGKAYKWLPSTRSAGFVWTTAGDFNLQVSVWDEAWNTDYCTVILTVRGEW
ncbi:MAG: hypothetical protein IPG48_14335 [Saprospiraceae bacterium]|nr:hypothetical protein [Saprospiraceae bacterium]